MKIEDLKDEELTYYFSQIQLLIDSPTLDNLLEMDPRNEFLRDVKTLHYRLKQELTLRRTEKLQKQYEKDFKSLEFEELTPDEMTVVIPEWPVDPETGEVDFYGKDDGERPMEDEGDVAPVQEHKEI